MTQIFRALVAMAVTAALLPICAGAASRRDDASELVVADATAAPTVLDPFRVYGTQAQSFFRLIFEPLVDRAPDGKIRTPFSSGGDRSTS
jgi:hypothetical protein